MSFGQPRRAAHHRHLIFLAPTHALKKTRRRRKVDKHHFFTAQSMKLAKGAMGAAPDAINRRDDLGVFTLAKFAHDFLPHPPGCTRNYEPEFHFTLNNERRLSSSARRVLYSGARGTSGNRSSGESIKPCR